MKEVKIVILQISVAQDWLLFHDSIQKFIAHNQDYTFMPYMPYLSVAFHFLFAAPSRPQIVYPNTNYEVVTFVDLLL